MLSYDGQGHGPPVCWLPFYVDEEYPAVVEISTDEEDEGELSGHSDLILFSSQSEDDNTISLSVHEDTLIINDSPEDSTVSHDDQVDNVELGDDAELPAQQDDIKQADDDNVVEREASADVAPPVYAFPDEADSNPITFDDGQGVDRREILVQDGIPRRHDRISFYETVP